MGSEVHSSTIQSPRQLAHLFRTDIPTDSSSVSIRLRVCIVMQSLTRRCVSNDDVNVVHIAPLSRAIWMLKNSQNGRKASSGKETDALAAASGGLPPLPRAGSVTPSCSSSKGKQGKSLEYSKTRERNLRYARRRLLRRFGTFSDLCFAGRSSSLPTLVSSPLFTVDRLCTLWTRSAASKTKFCVLKIVPVACFGFCINTAPASLSRCSITAL